jgi:hypothetical protein
MPCARAGDAGAGVVPGYVREMWSALRARHRAGVALGPSFWPTPAGRTLEARRQPITPLGVRRGALPPPAQPALSFRAKRPWVASGSGELGHGLPDAEGGRPRIPATRPPAFPFSSGGRSSHFPSEASRDSQPPLKAGLKRSEGPIGAVESAVAESVRATTTSQIGANPTRAPQGLARRHRPFRLLHHDLYAGRGMAASPYRVSDDDGPPATFLNL